MRKLCVIAFLMAIAQSSAMETQKFLKETELTIALWFSLSQI